MSKSNSNSYGREDGTLMPIHFVCQKCAQPLRLEKSLYQLDEPTLAELAGLPLFSHSSNDGAITLAPSTSRTSMGSSSEVIEVTRKYSANERSTENSNNGFMVIGETPNKDLENFSYTFKVMSRLFDILSDQSDVDHPLCEECTDNLLDQMDDQLKMTEEEYKDYKEFLERLQQTPANEDIDELEKELNQLQKEEAKFQKQLQEIEEEKNAALQQYEEQRKIEDKLTVEEERHWKEYCNHKRQLMLFEEEQQSVNNQLKFTEVTLKKLSNTNVFNSTFHIWYSGEFGTINNFRLGRLPNLHVEWHEINAAWGQTVLLLHSLANKIGLTFLRYRLVPYGNHSYLECLADKAKELPLYGAGGIRFFWDTKFDQAMVGFLDCLQQFQEEIQKYNTGFTLPYRMDKGRIEETGKGTASYSIRIQFNSEEQWTKALKYMLTNLKWGLTCVSSQGVVTNLSGRNAR